MIAKPSEFETPVTRDERSLDPEDWDALRDLGHRVFDDMLDYLKNVRNRPAWQPLPAQTKRVFKKPIPQYPVSYEAAYEEIKEHVLPYPTGNIHPRFWSWVGGTGTPGQLIADLVISAMNSGNLGFDESASTYVEVQLLDWLKNLLGYPEDASGLLVSGGSMANLVGLAVARNHMAGYDVREQGVNPTLEPRLVFYASTETHSSIKKAIELLGLGSRSQRDIPVRDDFTIDIDALIEAIAEDRKNGLRPACIIANVGTVNTGAMDPLNLLADIAAQENLWLHADAAFGALARLSPSKSSLADGLERVDSLAFDLHKWMYIQYDCGCAFVRSRKLHKDTFSVVPAYIRNFSRGLAGGPLNFSEYGVQLSRSGKALRAWLTLKTEGVDRYAEQIEQNIQQAAYLTELVEDAPDLELLAPTSLNIVNFRFNAGNYTEEQLDALNEEILMLVQERGIATPSSTELDGIFSIRVAIVNHRSRRSDFEALVNAVVDIGRELTISNIAKLRV